MKMLFLGYFAVAAFTWLFPMWHSCTLATWKDIVEGIAPKASEAEMGVIKSPSGAAFIRLLFSLGWLYFAALSILSGIRGLWKGPENEV